MNRANINPICLSILEGAYRWRGKEKSDEFAKKNDMPKLDFVLWPRLGVFMAMVDRSVGMTHIMDVTILYPWTTDDGSLEYAFNFTKTMEIYYYYRIYEIIDGEI